MQETRTKQVRFTLDNVDKCQCLECPVQRPSSCARERMQAVEGALRSGGQGAMPDAKEVPKVYCASGTASCGDLDFSQQCICPTCAVWQENDLANYKYCKNGPAAEIG